MRKVKAFTLLSSLYFVVLTGYIIYFQSCGMGADINQRIGILALLTLLWCAITSKYFNGTYFSLVFFVEASFYILTLGQTIICAFGIDIQSSAYAGLDLYKSDTAVDVNNTYLFTILCLALLNIGVIINGNKEKKKNALKGKKCEEKSISVDYSRSMITAGWILFALTIIPYLYEMIKLLSVYSVAGYRAAYSSIGGSTSWSKLFSMAGDYFPFALFMLLAAYKDKKDRILLPICFIISISLLNFVVGNRSEPICYIVALLWYFSKTAITKRAKRTTRNILILGGVLLVLIFPIIGETRNSGDLSVSSVLNSFTGKNSFVSSVVDTIIGMGWSAYPTVKTMQLIPASQGFRFGQSYFFAVLALVPNLIGGTHISVKYAGLAQWLMDTLHMNFGPGFSMPAEAYYNFGWFGLLMMPIIGFFIGKLLNESRAENNAMKLFILMGCFILFFSIPRRDTMTAIRSTVYIMGLIILFVRTIHKQSRRRFNKEVNTQRISLND